ncbi:aminotransferase class I/II-fold pyridoxal phosphate-dependent enzyme [Nostoc sp. PA-18-2419]|uniref:aminotransferase class I/II-fold pyridoxal phosphate-dependent enzyme n=1 Tax=Nostoc sp. PA-18-2419 TaxID=2575443 RepID=UPI0011097816|nr:aminotransferase class I/II-fold pyridoxal phosphate-dependent enzyme [Nostoc sp. PA-18-2419]
MNNRPPFTHLVQALPQTMSFIDPGTLERHSGRALKLRLGANESSFGISPYAREAMREAVECLTLYADPQSYDLRAKLASIHGITMKNLVVGSGIDDLIGLVVRTFIQRGEVAVTSFGAYPTFNDHVMGYGGQLHFVPYKDYYNDLQGLGETAARLKARILYLVNPDNPTGTNHTSASLQMLIEQLSPECLLLLDEAYIDFAPTETVLPIDPNNPRVIRLRTFSKAYGLAGARIGYAIASQETIAAFEKIRLHFGVNRIAQVGALASLHDPEFLCHTISAVEQGRHDYEILAREQGFSILPSATNFVAINTGCSKRAKAIVKGLLERDVFVRMPSAPPLDQCIRITIGTSQERNTFAEIFRELLVSDKGVNFSFI